MHGPRAPRMHVSRSRCWARKGAGGSGRWGVCTSAAAGGELSTTNGRSPHLGDHAQREVPPGSASIGSKFISSESQTCAEGASTERRGVRQCAKTVVNFSSSSCMVHQGASTRHAPLPDTPRKFPEPFQAPGDTRCHGRWITRTGARWRDGLRAMRQGRAMQAPSRSRTPGANGRTSEM